MKKTLFILFDNAVVEQSPAGDEELKFVPGVIHNLYRINSQLEFEIILILPGANISKQNSLALEILEREAIRFDLVKNTKPNSNSTVGYIIGKTENGFDISNNDKIVFSTSDWNEIYNYFKTTLRRTFHSRKTTETEIEITINPDGTGKYNISTGIGFFDHMLEQFSKHSSIDLDLNVKGDLHIDEHHTIEDTAIALGESVLKAVGSKKGMERYGFLLPMDDCLAQVAIDFGGRSWLVWEADFRREFIGDVPTEMFYHFFKSFCDGAKCNLNIKAEGTNEHHKIESIFKAFARAVKMAVAVNYESLSLPTTKGIL